MKTRQNRKRKLPSRTAKLPPIERTLVAAASMPVPQARKVVANLVAQLAKQICPSPPPKPKVTPRFRARCIAYHASHDLRSFAGMIRIAALAGDKLFFKYLAEYLQKKPKRLPISEQQIKLLQLYFQKPDLSAAEALKELRLSGSKGYYRAEKKKALDRATARSRRIEEPVLPVIVGKDRRAPGGRIVSETYVVAELPTISHKVLCDP
jgi:hypothetical protein